MRRLFVDNRYLGTHGIGRYAKEVLARVRPTWQDLELSDSPYSPLDAFRRLPAVDQDALVYSPGYGALVRAPRQVLTIHDLIQLRSPWPGRAKFEAYYAGPVRHAVRKAGVVLTVSETSARDIRAWVRDDSVRVVNAGNGCSSLFVADGIAAASDIPYIVFVGNIRRHKNFAVVLKALAVSRELRLRAVLPERDLAPAAALAEAAGVSAQVTWLSGLDDAGLAELYRGAAATVMPSVDEGFGLPALESIACGVPVIYWRGCESVAEIVGDRGWGIEASDDATSWADAFKAASETRRRVELATDAFSWDRTASTVSGELERLLA